MWGPLFTMIYISATIVTTLSINQLSFSGGGSFGAVEIGIFKKISENENTKYDLYTGISAGALNIHLKKITTLIKFYY